MKKIEFVSYDGKFPNLCSGKLTLKINDLICENRNCLFSGGSVNFDEEWNEEIEYGPWSVDFTQLEESWLMRFTPSEKKEILKLVNDNIPQGCCGGCV